MCVRDSGRSLGPWVDLASYSTDLSLISADPQLVGEEVMGKGDDLSGSQLYVCLD